MKKLVTLIFICFISITAFADEFSLFPWSFNQKDIYNACISKGWDYSADVSSDIPSFTFKPAGNVTYHGAAVYAIHFAFDKNNNVVSQAVTLSDMLPTDTVFASLLEYMITDHARLLSREVSTDDLLHIYIEASITDNVNAKYVVVGKNDNFQISIAYTTY